MTAPKSLVRRNGEVIEINSEELVPGDILIIDAGRYIPADVRLIESANLQIQESSLTGESVPVEVREGANILSGCININGLITAKVTKEYFDSTVNKVLDLVENAAAKKSKSERFNNKIRKSIYTNRYRTSYFISNFFHLL